MLAQSALLENPWMTVFPLEIAPSRASRWEMDLSPGSSTRPLILVEGLMVIFISDPWRRSRLQEEVDGKLGIIQNGLEWVKTVPAQSLYTQPTICFSVYLAVRLVYFSQ